MTTELFVQNLPRSNHWLVFWIFTLGLKFKFGVKEESGEDLSVKMMWVDFQILKKKKKKYSVSTSYTVATRYSTVFYNFESCKVVWHVSVFA